MGARRSSFGAGLPGRSRGSAVAAFAAAMLLCGCTPTSRGDSAGANGAPAARGDASPLFVEITREVGLGGSTAGWPDGTFTLPEIMQGGVALFDYDNDGDLDLLHVRTPPPGQPEAPAPDRLYRQQPDGTFVDVSAEAGCGDDGFGQAVAVGDADNDGDIDVYVANFGADRFYRNNGDGTFTDATSRAGFAGDRWSTSATFCDIDGDGYLDLYVVHYLKFDRNMVCLDAADKPEYCGPSGFPGEPDRLYRNNRDGTFTDVTDDAGIRLPKHGARARGLGVVCTDLTDDGLADFYVANDGESNQLWVNRGDGTFIEEAVVRGVAVNRGGKPEASMGVAAGDVDADGRLDLFVTHLVLEHNTLYRAEGGPLFTDRSFESQLAQHDMPFTGFGCGFFDYDNDGDLDLAVVNGRVRRGPELPGASLGAFWNLYGEPNLLFENDGRGTFSNTSGRAGTFASSVEVSRGLAFGDIDGDGDIDMVLSNVDDTLRIFRNDAPPPQHHWLLVRGLTRGRDALGAQLVAKVGERRMRRLLLSGYSYASASDPRVHFGLGDARWVDEIEVRWPDATRESFEITGVDREITLEQGKGKSR